MGRSNKTRSSKTSREHSLNTRTSKISRARSPNTRSSKTSTGAQQQHAQQQNLEEAQPQHAQQQNFDGAQQQNFDGAQQQHAQQQNFDGRAATTRTAVKLRRGAATARAVANLRGGAAPTRAAAKLRRGAATARAAAKLRGGAATSRAAAKLRRGASAQQKNIADDSPSHPGTIIAAEYDTASLESARAKVVIVHVQKRSSPTDEDYTGEGGHATARAPAKLRGRTSKIVCFFGGVTHVLTNSCTSAWLHRATIIHSHLAVRWFPLITGTHHKTTHTSPSPMPFL